jgi:putative transposase
VLKGRGRQARLAPEAIRLCESWRGLLLTTNAIENVIGSVRRLTRNVTRWRWGDMIAGWSQSGIFNAEHNFRRIGGYRYLPILAPRPAP